MVDLLDDSKGLLAESFDAGSLVRDGTIERAFIDFVLPKPIVEGLGQAADLGGN